MKKLVLPFRVKEPMLACGADMKGAFALAKGDMAYLFDGFGDLSDLDNYTRYEKTIKEAVKKLGIRPQVIACDLHPAYFSSRFAENYMLYASAEGGSAFRRKRYMLYKIQHHEAHVASAMVDNAVRGNVLGVAFDGTGYGYDGNIWGGEFFVGSPKNFKRASHLDYIPMPGAEVAVKEPWRMAASYLYSAFGVRFLKLKIDFVKNIDEKKWAILKEMIDKKINSPLTSSMGRLFDTVGSIVLNKKDAKFEAELPIELERIAGSGIDDHYDFNSTAKIIKGVVKDIEKTIAAPVISAKFHNTIAEMILNMAKKNKIKKIVLSGGVFQNKYLTKRTIDVLKNSGFMVYLNLKTETNDSGIPIGQIAIASAQNPKPYTLKPTVAIARHACA